MKIVSIRSTDPNRGLVAVLVEKDAERILAIPTPAHQALALARIISGDGDQATPSWVTLLSSCCRQCGGRLTHLTIDVDEDGALCTHLCGTVTHSAHMTGSSFPPAVTAFSQSTAPLMQTAVGSSAQGSSRFAEPCRGGDGLVAAASLGLPIVATSRALRMRSEDLSGRSVDEKVDQWRGRLLSTSPLTAASALSASSAAALSAQSASTTSAGSAYSAL